MAAVGEKLARPVPPRLVRYTHKPRWPSGSPPVDNSAEQLIERRDQCLKPLTVGF